MNPKNVTAVLMREPDEVYRQMAKEYLSSHQLGDFRKCPALYQKKKLGLLPDEDRPAYLLGRAVHTLVLEGHKTFGQVFAVGGPVNPRTGKPFGAATQAYQEWAAAQGRPVITDDQYALITNIAAGITAHVCASGLLSAGVPEGVVRADYCGKNCQIRVDWLNPIAGIVDLKTCDDLTWFESDAKRYGYAHQLAFYQCVLELMLGEKLPVHMIAVEKKDPFRCGVWQISDQTLAHCQHENEAAIERLKACELNGYFPTGYEECRVFDAI
jgi:hypothetical protein